MNKADIQIYIRQAQDDDQPEALRLAASRFAARQGWDFPQEPGLTTDEGGKPYFSAMPSLKFSLSHSGDFWLVAISTVPLGLDVQQHQSCRREAVAQRFFHAAEAEWLRQRDYAEKDFFALWTAKESYVKYTGQGIDDHFAAFSVIENGELAENISGARLTFLPFYPGYTVCLCAGSPGLISYCWLID